MPKTAGIVYAIHFPRRWDEGRPSWRLEVLDEVLALPDVVDATFPDLTAAWRPAAIEGIELRESRRCSIEVVTVSKTPAAASAARAAILAYVRSIKRQSDDQVVVTSHAADVEAV